MEILDQIEEARKEFVDKLADILPDGYGVSQICVSVDLHDRTFNADLIEEVDWVNGDAGGAYWVESSSSFCDKVTVFYDKED